MPRPLHEQVVVITGASSGIGREAALRFGRAGARVVVAARNQPALETLVTEIRGLGGRAIAVPTDVASEGAVEALAESAIREFGRIDTWVNNAATAVYGRMTDVPVSELRRVMDVTYWGSVYGFRAAIARMAAEGGTIVTVGSAEAEMAMPLQSAYGAAKHAQRALCEAVRIELAHDRIPIQVSLIKPASVDTPFYETVRTRMGVAPKPVPPVYDPAVIAREILRAAVEPKREVLVGGVAQAMVAVHALAPGVLDRALAWAGYPAQQGTRPKRPEAPNSLFEPMPGAGNVRRTGSGWKVSWVMWLENHPTAAAAITGAAVATAAAYAANRRRR
jgi:NAD(P)-dependent dehydrogenase (short-subunit alcohol dehydrogenase family)